MILLLNRRYGLRYLRLSRADPITEAPFSQRGLSRRAFREARTPDGSAARTR